MAIVPFVDLRQQYHDIKDEVRAAIDRVLDSANFILGPEVEAFEEAFAAYIGVAHCVGVGSGTAALKLALEALGVGSGDEVIVPVNTYIASALAVSQTGATPVFVDVDADRAPSIDAIERAVTGRTKAIMPVHLYGRALDLRPVMTLAIRRKLFVVEDACQAHGAVVAGVRAGASGHVGCFSFYPGKNLGAYGDGGAVTTNDAAIADSIRLMRDFGQREKYHHLIKGDNCRLDAVQAAVLRAKLRRLDDWNANRIRLASLYERRLADAGLPAWQRRTDGSDVVHLYVLELPNRDRVRERLGAEGVQTGVHYPVPIHLQPAYAELGLRTGSFPRAEASAARLLSLPMYPELTDAQVDYVVSALEKSVRPAKPPLLERFDERLVAVSG